MQSDDIVDRLRECNCVPHGEICREAADDIEDLRFQLQGTIGELENALSRERTLLNEQEDCRIGSDNLHAEIERMRSVIKTQQDRIEQSVRDNDRTVYLCAARYHRLQTIRELVVKHGVVDPLRHDIILQTDSLD